MVKKISMVDLKSQYLNIKQEIDASIQAVVDSGVFINGSDVHLFSEELAEWLGVKYVIPCANGTDALQLALMVLQLNRGDEIIVPSFTYAATVEVISLLGLKPVFVDVNPNTFNLNTRLLAKAITSKTKVIIPVHLFGQCAEMENILFFAEKFKLKIIEDTAQALGAEYRFTDGTTAKAGTIGDIGTTSFFPSKNLGCYGDGGAIFTNDDELANLLKMMANHGQKIKYYHDVVGCNSRLDSIQAAILRVKLRYLSQYGKARQEAANFYLKELKNIRGITLPFSTRYSTHVYNQFTLKINFCNSFKIPNFRDLLKIELEKHGIPTMVYYPVPIHLQKAYRTEKYSKGSLPVSENLSKTVLSLPIHTEMNENELKFITDSLKSSLNKLLITVPVSQKSVKWNQTILHMNRP